MRGADQAVYKWPARPVSDRDRADAHTTKAIVDVHADDPEFGYWFRPQGAWEDAGPGCA
jgi:hypothetical protein